MTDWLPWALVFMTGVFATLWLLIRTLEESAPAGADFRRVRLAFLVTLVATVVVYALHVVAGESWLPYV